MTPTLEVIEAAKAIVDKITKAMEEANGDHWIVWRGQRGYCLVRAMSDLSVLRYENSNEVMELSPLPHNLNYMALCNPANMRVLLLAFEALALLPGESSRLQKLPAAFEVIDTENGIYLTRSEQAAINTGFEYHGLYRRDGSAPAPLPVAVKVKPLGWVSIGEVIFASTPFGSYEIRPNRTSSTTYPLELVVPGEKTATRFFYFEDKAKAAAQADYETRIRSALSSPVGGMEEDCRHCKGKGCQPGDPEGAPLEPCDYCGGSGKSAPTPASDIAALREELACTYEELINHNGDDLDDTRARRVAELRSLQHVAKGERG